MLGEQVGDERGTVTGVRAVAGDGAGPQIEVSFRAEGTMAGLPVQNVGTYLTRVRPDGLIDGEGQGVLLCSDGVATWRATGVGRPTGDGLGASWRGAVHLTTTVKELARLNAVALVYEHETSGDGQVQTRLWEWS